MRTHIQSITLVKTPTFEVKIADSLQEIEGALRLRFEVFNLELHEGLASSFETGFDSDVYDTFCDHLIVKENETGRIVGTYRLLKQDKAEAHIGFYSEGEFDVQSIKQLGGSSLEVGRSCVAKEFRSIAVINLLWSGIARYMEQHAIDRLFGCVSLHTKDITELSLVNSLIHQQYLAPSKYLVSPHPHCMIDLKRMILSNDEIDFAFKKFPPLLKGYLRLGALICSAPAIDKEFGTIDYLILLDSNKITERYRDHYCKSVIA